MRSAAHQAPLPWRLQPVSGQVDVVVIERLAVDAVARRGDPGGDLAALEDRLHKRADIGLVHVGLARLTLALLPLMRAQFPPVRAGLDRGERSDAAVERYVRQPQPVRQPG